MSIERGPRTARGHRLKRLDIDAADLFGFALVCVSEEGVPELCPAPHFGPFVGHIVSHFSHPGRR
jgi:hypothetical protein